MSKIYRARQTPRAADLWVLEYYDDTAKVWIKIGEDSSSYKDKLPEAIRRHASPKTQYYNDKGEVIDTPEQFK